MTEPRVIHITISEQLGDGVLENRPRVGWVAQSGKLTGFGRTVRQAFTNLMMNAEHNAEESVISQLE